MQPERIQALLSKIYGGEAARGILQDLLPILERYQGRIPAPPRTGLSQRDTILITYADQVQAPGEPPLRTLADFCDEHLQGLVSGIHVLPFFPWSSDDGFS